MNKDEMLHLGVCYEQLLKDIKQALSNFNENVGHITGHLTK